MKKKFTSKILRSAILSYIVFFILFAFVLSCSFLLFFSGITSNVELTREQIETAATNTFFNVLFITGLFTVFDIVRRKTTVDRHVKQIKTALSKITKGDFDIRLNTIGVSSDFAEIMTSINTMTEELSGVETLKTDFISNVSHEMKTPLAVIGNYGTLLQAPDISEEEKNEYAKNITMASKKLAELITNILKLNKLENQQIFPHCDSYNLSEQLCECLLQFENIWEEKGIEIDTEIAEDVNISADSELLSIVWNNLLSNAFKFTDDGGKVGVTLSDEADHVIVSVTDSGCGIDADTGKHIFEKFYQGDTSRATYGNGLGLALVKRIVDITGSEISVKSAVGAGSTFTVKIPENHNEKI